MPFRVNPIRPAKQKSPISGDFLWSVKITQMKQTISKIFFIIYVLSVSIIYIEWLFNMTLAPILHTNNGFFPRTLTLTSALIFPLCFLILNFLDSKRFFKIKYFLISIFPFILTLAVIGEMREHGWIYLMPIFH